MIERRRARGPASATERLCDTRIVDGRHRLAWTVLAAACMSGAPEAERLELPDSEVPDDAETPTIPDGAIVARGSGKCVDAAFPEVKGPPDEGSTMTITPKPRTFGSITCAGEREVWIDPKGRLDVCTIAKPTKVHGLALAGDNYTHFHLDGRAEQTTLAKPHELATAAGVVIPCAAAHVSLDTAGHVEHCTLARQENYGEIACAKAESIALRPESGALWACVLAEPISTKGITVPNGTRVAWHDNGAVETMYLHDEVVVDGIRMRYEVELHPDGQLAHYTLADSRTIGGIALETFAKVWMYPNGSPWHLEYVADEGFMIHGEPWRDTRGVTFACDGSITSDHTEHYQAQTRPPRMRGLD